MKFNLYVVNAFTKGSFSGNPAAYVPLTNWLPDQTLQAIAEQHNLSETVFTVPDSDTDSYHIRWFTPTIEVDLCGHATLAAAHIMFNELDLAEKKIHLHSKSGPLTVSQNQDQLTLDFPTDHITKASNLFDFEKILGSKPTEIYQGRNDLLLIYPDEQIITSMRPNFNDLSKIDVRGIIVSSTAADYDFISRGFFPAAGINEDPATGSAHTTLCPYWSERLQKTTLTAKQCSKRGGYFICENLGDRTLISGQCQTYLRGAINF